MVTLRVELPWPPRSLSPNARKHWSQKNDTFQEAKRVAYYACRKAIADIEALDRPKPQDGVVNVTLHCVPPDARRRDEDNLLASCKSYLDGIAAALGVDDSRFHFRELQWSKPDGRKNARLIIEIEV